MKPSSQHELRCMEIGREIFERATAAEPGFWRQAWWVQKANDYLLAHEQLKIQLFRFIDVLPAMRTERDIARHLQEYLLCDDLDIPKPLRLALCYRNHDGVMARAVAGFTRFASHMMAGSFITGSNTAEAITNATRLRAKNMAFTMDVLGETTTNNAQADQYAATYLELVDGLGRIASTWPVIPRIDHDSQGPMPRANISIKLTALDPRFDAIDPVGSRERVCSRLRPILRRAQEVGALVNVDIESFRVRDLTFELFMGLLNEPEFRDWADVGVVVQAYLQDGEKRPRSVAGVGRAAGYSDRHPPG